MNSLSNRRGGTSSHSDKSMEISSGSGLPLDPVNGNDNDNDNDNKECKAMRSGGMSATKLSKICRYALPIILFFMFGVLYYIPINEVNLVSNYLVASVPTVLIDCKDCKKVCFIIMDEKGVVDILMSDVCKITVFLAFEFGKILIAFSWRSLKLASKLAPAGLVVGRMVSGGII